MRVITYVMSSLVIVVTSFNIRTIDNSNDTPPDEMLRRMAEELQREFDEKLGESKHIEETAEKRDTVTGDIGVWINANGIATIVHQLTSSVRHDVIRHAPTSLQTKYLGMELRIDSIQVAHFHPPAVHVETHDSFIRLSTRGGLIRLLGIYSAVYRTTREGQLDASIEDLHIQLDLPYSDGKITMDGSECSQSIGAVDITLRPTMPPQIKDQIREVLIDRISAKICPSVKEYVAKLLKVARKIASIERPVEQDSLPHLVPHTLISTNVADSGATLLFAKKSVGQPGKLQVPEKSSSMVSVAVTQKYVNDYIENIAADTDIVFQLHRVPEIHDALKLSCSETSSCLGNLVNLHSAVDGSAHLSARATLTPRIEFSDGRAAVLLSLDCDLSFRNRAAHHRVSYLTFSASVNLRIKSLRLIRSEEKGHYRWQADYEIEDVQVSDVNSLFEEMDVLGKQLSHIVKKRKSELEGLLSTNLSGVIPLQMNPHIRLEGATARFSHEQATFDADLKIERRLFPVFDFSTQ